MLKFLVNLNKNIITYQSYILWVLKLFCLWILYFILLNLFGCTFGSFIYFIKAAWLFELFEIKKFVSILFSVLSIAAYDFFLSLEITFILCLSLNINLSEF